jgi:hypothetical protein
MNNPDLPQLTPEQARRLVRFIANFAKGIAEARPTLNPDIAAFEEAHKAMLSGIRIAISVLFGKEESENVFRLAEETTMQELGYIPDLTPSSLEKVLDNPAFAEWFQATSDWTPPTS